jgi:hypothetical protein
MAKILHIVHRDDGEIIAASESKNPPRPVQNQGMTVGAFEVPAKFADKKMHEYVPRMMVDVSAGRLKEK